MPTSEEFINITVVTTIIFTAHVDFEAHCQVQVGLTWCTASESTLRMFVLLWTSSTDTRLCLQTTHISQSFKDNIHLLLPVRGVLHCRRQRLIIYEHCEQIEINRLVQIHGTLGRSEMTPVTKTITCYLR